MAITLARLRADAIRRAFPKPATLKTAIKNLGFIQADPIRSPARAQDLILRHRVKEYRAGDLERLYPKLDVEEDYLYAYGFLTRENWSLLHPRVTRDLSSFDKQVLQIVTQKGLIHPRELEAHLGPERALNPWGGYSKATTRSLQTLHFHGLLRIARREHGIRLYEAAPPPEADPLSVEDRLRRLVLLVCRILAPMPLRGLTETLRLLRYSVRGLNVGRSVVAELIRDGEVETAEVEGIQYVWPAGRIRNYEAPAQVRFLAPFDPLVWDRRRFEHFWGWAYRFEAYTPERKRVRGYYAMPLLWRDQVIGWANARVAQGQINLQVGFQSARPASRNFATALEEETERMRVFLGTGRP
jgi:uncharacterized protein